MYFTAKVLLELNETSTVQIGRLDIAFSQVIRNNYRIFTILREVYEVFTEIFSEGL